jgi:peptidoglycan/xylan/chitin deacetylase (PgdA/CDA1 family)
MIAYLSAALDRYNMRMSLRGMDGDLTQIRSLHKEGVRSPSIPKPWEVSIAAPTGFTWPDGSRLALSIVVNVEEGAEQNIRDGDKGPEVVDELSAIPRQPIRAYANESNYAYGINAGAPRILKLLREYGVQATATAAALALERAPQVAAQLVADGHEVCCHGWRWEQQFAMDEDQERDFIRKGWQSIERTCGQRPAGWLSRYLHTANTRRLLLEEGYSYHMDDFSDDFPFWDSVDMADGAKRPLVILPYALDTNDMKMWVTPALTPRDWLQYAIDTFDWLYAEADSEGARMMSVGLHLRIIGRPGRTTALKAFLDHVKSKSDVWIASRAKIAAAFAAAVPAP